jgi:hypothetical protein
MLTHIEGRGESGMSGRRDKRRRLSTGRPLAVALALTLALTIAAPLRGKSVSEGACGYFSPDPDDRAGPPVRFSAQLSAAGQRAPTESPGVGRADFVLERDTLTMSWSISFAQLTSEPVALKLHGPLPAEGEAPALFDLTSGIPRSPVKGQRVLSLGEVAYAVQNLLYVNLSTTRYPVGEIRGTVRKLRPEC